MKTVIALVLAGVIGLGLWANQLVTSTRDWLDTPIGEATRLTVARGQSIGSLLTALSGDESTPDLRILRRLNPELMAIQAGTYDFSGGMSRRDVLQQVVAGDTVVEFFTIIPGSNIYQLQAALAADARLIQTLPANLEDWEQVLPFEGWPDGQFLPDTYGFSPGDRDIDILLRAHEALSAVLQSAWLARTDRLPLTNPQEVLILASIVEKESSQPDEWRQIAGVFTQRLKKGMRLQTDPTVIYGLLPDFDGNIRRKDLRAKTPWNTYVIKGLPPTPIAMPSFEAIEATVNPLENGYLYFVADGTGGHDFSKTYAEHDAKVDRYIRNRQ